ncbi:MAG: ABC-type lipoprotein release transport system permease subunit, partial [Planctomycetota bacterium]
MYRLFLAIRYLLTRPINLLGMGGIAIGVWALVVVVSLFSGFLQVIEEHVQASSSDIVATELPAWA